MLSLLSFIITISLLVFVHEFGHYYVARLFGMKIEIFSIGFGKELFSRIDKEGVKWKIGILPLGGYVKIHGFDSQTLEKDTINSGSFRSKALYAQFLTIIAGPLANYLLAIFIFTTIYFFQGQMQRPAIVSEVISNSPAAKAGLLENDKIIMIDQTKIHDFSELQKIVLLTSNKSSSNKNSKDPLNLIIERNGEIIHLSIIIETIPQQNKDSKILTPVPYIGIVAKNQLIANKLNIFESLYQAVINVIDISNLIWTTIWQMIIGTRPVELVGPISIAKESGKSLSYGLTQFWIFVAMISINLGLFNLLPIPILDGGQLIFIIYEGIFRKALNQRLKNVILNMGVLITIFLIVISLSNDIKSLMF